MKNVQELAIDVNNKSLGCIKLMEQLSVILKRQKLLFYKFQISLISWYFLKNSLIFRLIKFFDFFFYDF